MATILEKLVAANATLNSKKSHNIQANVQAKKNIDWCVKLLLKGYCLDDDMTNLISKYNHILHVPDAKNHAGKVVTANKMQELMELIYPKVPHNYLVMIMVQKFGDELANYISNGERSDMVKALRSLSDKLESGNTFPMAEEN